MPRIRIRCWLLPDIRRLHATAMRSLDEFARGKLAALERAQPAPHAGRDRPRDGIWVERDGRRLLSFSCNDYLNLTPASRRSRPPRSRRSSATASAPAPRGSSPATIRSTPSWRAGWRGSRAPRRPACSAPAISPMPASSRRWSGRGDLILIDELAHACLWTGARLSRRRACCRFRHNDVAHAEALLAEHRAGHAPRADRHRRRVLHGRRPARRSPSSPRWRSAFDAWLLADDAHGLGVVGGGRGSTFASGGADVPLQMGTLSKALGGYGGYLCASQPVIDLMRNRARTFIYSTGLPPPVVAAAIAALDLIEREPAYADAAAAQGAGFHPRARPAGGAERRSCRWSSARPRRRWRPRQLLEAEGFLVVAIRPPTVPAGTARLRFAFTRAASRRRDRAACRHRAHARHRALTRERDLHHRDRHRRRQDLRGRGADPAFARSWAARSTRSSRSSAASIRRRPRPAIPACCSTALGRPVTPDEIERISPWRFRAPLSPDMAARARRPRASISTQRGRVLPGRDRAKPRRPADRRRRRHHGAARRRAHRARL